MANRIGPRLPDNMPLERRSSRKILIAAGIGMVVFFFVINDLWRWFEGGGIFSIISAIRAVHKQARVVDVDGAGLLIVFMAGCSFVVTSVCVQLNAGFEKRLIQYAFIFPIIGGGFVLDGVYGETVIQNFMSDQGYSRCVARDYSQGRGKSRVWFQDYVRNAVDCPPYATGITPALTDDPRSVLPRPARSIGSPAAWFTSDDYPVEALRNGVGGRIKVGVLVDADGRVARCRAIISSGSELLDARTCGLLTARARYWPARDAAGNPIAQFGTLGIRWIIPNN